jgi:hypothetical protein
MPFRIDSDDALLKLAAKNASAARDLRPATLRFGEWVAREARRNAPVGKGRRRGALKRSLNHREPAHNVTELTSPLPYAAIQEHGGVIRAGSGPLGSRLLAIPLNATARQLLDSLGASTSLRDVHGLQFVKTKSGKMFLVRPASVTKSGRERRGNVRREQINATQFLFVLVPRVTIRGHNFAPRLDDPQTRVAAARFIKQHLRGQTT